MVRVAADKSETRSAWLSLIGALAVALLAVAALTYFREPPPAAAPQRRLTNSPVKWTCELNPAHEFTAPGRFDPLPCSAAGCPGQCSIRVRFRCLAHERGFDAWLRFEPAPAGRDEHVVAFRYMANGAWRPSSDGRVPCPQPGCRSDTEPVNDAWTEEAHRPANTNPGGE
jgi:hypothetical protein